MNNYMLYLVLLTIIFCFSYCLYYVYEIWQRAQKVNLRIQSVAAFGSSLAKSNSPQAIRVSKESIIEKKLNKIFSTNVTGENLITLKLYRCGIKTEVKKIAIYLGVFWLLVLSLCWILTNLSPFHCILSSLGLTIVLFWTGINYLENSRKEKGIKELAAAVDIILRGIKGGSSVEKTLIIAAREVQSPLKEEFQQIIKELEFGVSFDKVMKSAATRVNIADFYFFTTALIIQRRSGGSLADVLENIINSLMRVQEIRLKIKVYSSEAKTSGYVLAGLPVVIWFTLMAIKPEHIEFFSTDPLGQQILMVAIGLFFAALITIKRLVTFRF